MIFQSNRSILHMDLDTFFVSVERLRNSELVGKPMMIGGTGNRGVVAACSYESRKFGVHSGMPMRMARQLCPDAIVISGDMEAYSNYSKQVTDVVRDQSPMFEKSSIDEFYIDLTGMDRFFGCYSWASELRETIIKETGLPISFGLSVNKMVSKVATGVAKPNGQKEIERGKERDFLAPMSIGKIPMIGQKTFRLLRGMGIDKVITLREMPIEMMERLLGKNGIVLWKRANAIDESLVVPHSEAKSLSTERTFIKDTIDVIWLRSMLLSMTESLAFKLRQSQKLTSCVTVKLRYASFDTFTKQKRIPYTSCDHVLIKYVQELFEILYDRRLLIRLVGVRFSGLVQGNYQVNLFDDTAERIQLYQAIDLVKVRHGQDKLQLARGFDVMSKRPIVNPFSRE